MTKQSLGAVTAMEARGPVESRRLDTDRRVRLVVPTKAGLATAATMAGHLAAIEDQWRNEVGARRYDSMKAVLDELGRDEFWLTDRSATRALGLRPQGGDVHVAGDAAQPGEQAAGDRGRVVDPRGPPRRR